MRKPILLLLLFNLYLVSPAQIIKGIIQDQQNDSIISVASIYLNGTSIGTHSDQRGYFELDISKFSTMPLTISALGYLTSTLSGFPTDKQFVVYLTPKIFELKEVVISSSPSEKAKERVKNMRLFRNEFLGMTANAHDCVIANESDISFTTTSDKDTLKAFSSKPIIIINKALGYKITYFLDNFELKTNYFLRMTGSCIFTEDTTSDQSQINLYERKRKIAFLGSRMHFFRALWQNEIESSGFIIKDWAGEKINYNTIITHHDKSGQKTEYKLLKYPEDLNITYYPNFGKSRLKVVTKAVLFDRSGYYDPLSLTFEGEMAIQRIADLLPFDYLMDSKETGEQSIADSAGVVEKVYLHTDRTYYYTGDDIWFKAYLIEAENNLLTNQSNNLHVELISPASKIISSRIIRLEDGLGNGDFKLSDDIGSGRYRLRAYTNHMRNFSDELFFIKDIIVINSKDNSEEPSNNVKYVDKTIQIGFYPEGGSMVDNVSSIVAFKAVDEKDKGCEISGKIFSSTGDLITTFKSVHNGMGSFFLRPYPGLSYYSIIKGSDSIEIKTDLPKSFYAGVTLNTSINDKNELVVTTKTNPQTLPVILEHDLMLNFSARKELIKSMSYRIKSPTTSFVIPTDDLPEGIIMVTLSASEDLPLSERLIYIQRNTPVNIKIESDKMIYKKREPVALNISLSGDSTIGREGNISLAVADKSMTESSSIYPRNISSWFLLESDVRGYVEDPSYYFDPSNSERLKYLDLLLRTQGWRDFAWKYDSTYYPKETGFTISGRLRKYYTNKTIEDSKVNIGIFESKNTITTTIPVDSSGRFTFSGIDLTGEARVIVTGIGKRNHLQGLLVMDSVHYIPAEIPLSQSIVTTISETKLSSLISYYEINESVRKKYKLSDTIGLDEVRIIAEKPKDLQTIKVESSRVSYGTPDDELIITKQMESYRNPLEILKGRLPGVEVSGMYPDYKIRIRGVHSFGSSLPLVLVDGFITSFEDLVSMPIYFIDRIDVLKSGGATAMYGMQGTNGVINIITRTADRVSEYIPVNYSVNIKISGYSAPRIFYSPQHLPNLESSFVPDFRSTLYWEPNINLNSNKKVVIKYYNGDNSSIIKVIAEGITTTGIPVTGKFEYEVK